MAHFHYVLVTGAVFSILAAAYWLPKWTGHMYDERLGQWHFWCSLVSVNVLFFPLHFCRAGGHTSPHSHYALQFTDFNMLQPGGFAFGLSQLLFVWGDQMHQRRSQGKAIGYGRAEGLEWTLSSPLLSQFPDSTGYPVGRALGRSL